LFSTWFSSVVFPAPRNPESTVTGNFFVSLIPLFFHQSNSVATTHEMQ
jgi:hypothetical protein